GAGNEATMPGRAAHRREDVHHSAQPKRATGTSSIQEITLGRGGGLTLREVVTVAREGARVHLAPEAVERIQTTRAVVERIEEEGRQLYGVTAVFGHLGRVATPREQLASLQRNLIRSHASGVGEPFDIPTTRAVTLLLANSLSRGHSGV